MSIAVNDKKIHKRGIYREHKNFLWGLLFASPGIIYIVVFNLIPVLQSAYYSFCDYGLLSAPRFIGLDNYIRMLHDDRVLKGLLNTLFMEVTLPIPMGIALFLAILLNKSCKRMSLYRTMFYIPSMVPSVAMGIIFLWMLNGQHGVVNYILRIFGIEGPLWLLDEKWSKPALLLTCIWHGGGKTMLIYLAALQSIPKSLYEAAELDGANALRRFRHITFPYLSPVTIFLLITGMSYVFMMFTETYIFTRGGQLLQSYGPNDSLLMFAQYIYDYGFVRLEMGYASALSWLVFVFCAAISILVFMYGKKRVYYGGGEEA